VQILNFDRQIMEWHRSNEASKRLDEIPGVGPALANALVASLADPIWTEFSAWIGRVPKQIAGARISSAASANRAIAIYATCSRRRGGRLRYAKIALGGEFYF
jgi:transposase